MVKGTYSLIFINKKGNMKHLITASLDMTVFRFLLAY